MYNREGGYREGQFVRPVTLFPLPALFILNLQLLPTRAGNVSATQGFFCETIPDDSVAWNVFVPKTAKSSKFYR